MLLKDDSHQYVSVSLSRGTRRAVAVGRVGGGDLNVSSGRGIGYEWLCLPKLRATGFGEGIFLERSQR